MSIHYVNESTSVVLVDGYNFLPTESSIVYVSSSKEVGHLVTILDQTGYISTPKRIVVSSTEGVHLSTGVSSIILDQRFSYVTLLSLSPTLWTFINTPPLFGLGSNPSILGAESITVSVERNINRQLISTLDTEAKGAYLESTTVDSVTAFSTLGIQLTSPATLSREGLLRLAGRATIDSNLSIQSTLTVNSSILIAGSISTLGNVFNRQTVTVGGNISTSECDIVIGRNLTSLGQTTIQDTVQITSTVSSAASVYSPFVSTFQLLSLRAEIPSSIHFNATQILNTPSGFFIPTALTTPALTARTGLAASNSIQTSTLTVRSFGPCESLQTILGNSLQIINSNGSLQVSSILLTSTNRTPFSTLFASQFDSSEVISTAALSFSSEAATATETIRYADGTVSTIPIQFSISSISTNRAFLNANQKILSTSIFSVDSLRTNSFGAPTLAIEELVVSTFGIGSNLTFTGPDVIAPSARIANENGLISTVFLSTNTTLLTGPISLNTFRSLNPFTLCNTTVEAPVGGAVTFVSTNVFATDQVSTYRIVVGTPPNPGAAVAPTIVQVDVSNSAYILKDREWGLSTPTYKLDVYPWQYRYGTGNFYDPVQIYASQNYEQVWSLYDIDNSKRLYLNAEINVQALSTNISYDFPIYYDRQYSEFSVNINGTAYAFSNTITGPITSCNFGVYDFDITDIPLTGVNPYTLDDTSYVYFKGHGMQLGVGTPSNDIIQNFRIRSRCWLSYTPNSENLVTQSSFLNSNEGIFMRNGPLIFSTFQNATTIYNAPNDIQTRNLFYTGTLYSPSDSTLKEKIQHADIRPLASTFSALPLRYYTYTGDYISTFQPADKRRLGFITTEVKPLFPNAVKTAPMEYMCFSSIDTLDTTDIKYSHIAATKALMAEIDSLKQDLRYLYSLVEADERDR